MKNVKNGYYINGKIYVNSYDEFMETIENESLGNDEFLYFMAYVEDTDDYIQMNEPANYYKDEYGICPHCKHKLSKGEMKRKRCSKCLQKLSGKTIAFTRKELITRYLVARIITLLFVIALCLEPIKVILGTAIIVLVILLVWGIIYGVS